MTEPTPTQVQHPWRAVVRTIVAAIPLVPIIVTALGVESVPWVASGLAGIAAVTRVLAIPAVNAWLTENLGGVFAATPRQP